MNANTRSFALPGIGDFPLTIVVLAVCVGLPFLIHLIPFRGPVPIGAMLLPMFYAPLAALILFRFRVAFGAGVLAPVVNYLLTGQPILETTLLLSLELGLFSVFVYFLLQSRTLRWIAGPLAYLLTKLFSSLMIGWFPIEMTSVEFWMSSVSNGLPGLLILSMINVAILKLWKSKS